MAEDSENEADQLQRLLENNSAADIKESIVSLKSHQYHYIRFVSQR
jgi:hypothetical protein